MKTNRQKIDEVLEALDDYACYKCYSPLKNIQYHFGIKIGWCKKCSFWVAIGYDRK